MRSLPSLGVLSKNLGSSRGVGGFVNVVYLLGGIAMENIFPFPKLFACFLRCVWWCLPTVALVVNPCMVLLYIIYSLLTHICSIFLFACGLFWRKYCENKSVDAVHSSWKKKQAYCIRTPLFVSMTSQSVVVWVSIVHDFLGNSMPFSMHASSTFSEKRTLHSTGPAGQRGNLSKCLWPGAENPSCKIAVRSSGAHSERSKWLLWRHITVRVVAGERQTEMHACTLGLV